MENEVLKIFLTFQDSNRNHSSKNQTLYLFYHKTFKVPCTSFNYFCRWSSLPCKLHSLTRLEIKHTLFIATRSRPTISICLVQPTWTYTYNLILSKSLTVCVITTSRRLSTALSTYHYLAETYTTRLSRYHSKPCTVCISVDLNSSHRVFVIVHHRNPP